MAKLVENVYGEALFDLAREQSRIEEYGEEARALIRVLDENPELTQMMTHPNIDKEEKLKNIETIFKGRATNEMIGLMRMVAEKNHFGDMRAILKYYIKKEMEYRNIGIADVTTPIPLSEERKKDVEAKLKETTDYVSFEMNYHVDPELIGGMVIRIGDRVVDSSVRGKLNRLSSELSKIELKAGESTT